MAKAKIALLYERLSRDEDDLEDKINTIIDGRKMVKNSSYFAFTVTPKNKTLEMFGKKKRLPDGTTKPEPHYVYTMSQNLRQSRRHEEALEGHNTDNTPKGVPKRSANCISFSGNL